MLYSERGFSLVELSIVLVILGLLAGGILAGQNLIRAAQLRSIHQDLSQYITITNAFQQQYQALPGDMPYAVRFWGAQAGGTADGQDAACAALGVESPASGKATCNGNGDGAIKGYEMWRYWQHLSNADLVAGQFTGVNGDAAASVYVVAGQNMPVSRASGGGFVPRYLGAVSDFFAGTVGHWFFYGGTEGVDQQPGMIPAGDAWSLDTKIDDGKPGTGAMRTYRHDIRPSCVTQGDAATAEYRLDTDVLQACNLLFRAGF